MNREKARLEILSQNRKDLQTQVARIKQIIEKVLDKDTYLAEIIRTLFREQGITIISVLTTLSMTISTIVLAITGVFGEEEVRLPHRKMKEPCLNGYAWLNRLADAFKRLARKAAKALPPIVRSVVGVILSFLGKAFEFVAEHTWV